MLLQPFKLSSFSPLLTEVCSNQTASSDKIQTFPTSLISPGEGRVLGTCSHAVSCCSSAFSPLATTLDISLLLDLPS